MCRVKLKTIPNSFSPQNVLGSLLFSSVYSYVYLSLFLFTLRLSLRTILSRCIHNPSIRCDSIRLVPPGLTHLNVCNVIDINRSSFTANRLSIMEFYGEKTVLPPCETRNNPSPTHTQGFKNRVDASVRTNAKSRGPG